MVDIKKFTEMDLYGLFDIQSTAQEAEIRKAYRKKALSCHPDKNPDNPKAAELFQQLTQALEVLLDKTARAAYDRVQNAKKSAEIRHKQLDAKRQKLKTDLEERERRAAEEARQSRTGYKANKTPEQVLQEELDRLRREGNRLVEEEMENMRRQMREERVQKQPVQSEWDSAQHRIRITWKADKNDPLNGGYNEETLRNYLKKYGEITGLVMSPKKNGSALVEFKIKQLAEMAVRFEMGNVDNPLKLEWLSDAKPSKPKKPKLPPGMKEADLETLEQRQKRQAEERRKLIEQMLREEND